MNGDLACVKLWILSLGSFHVCVPTEDRGNEVTFTTFAPSPDVGEGIVWVCGRMGEIYFSNSLFLFHYFYQAVG